MKVRTLPYWLKYAEHALFEKLIPPPLPPSPRLRQPDLDYPHAFLFEELFCVENGVDVAGALALVKAKGGPVLDIGGGKGRLSIPLAARGFSVTLVDNSEAMLSEARHRRAALEPEARERLQIVSADMTRLELSKRYPLALAIGITIPYFSDPQSIRAALVGIRESLDEQGTFFFDVHDVRMLKRSQGWGSGRWKYWRKKHPLPVRRVWGRTFAAENESIGLEHAVRLVDGTLVHLTTRFHAWKVDRWENVLDEAGLKLTGVYRDWNLTPFGEANSIAVLSAARK